MQPHITAKPRNFVMTPATKPPLQNKQLLILFATALGLSCGFGALYFSTIPIFLKPLATQFGWGRGGTAAAVVLAMLGQAVGAVVIGRLIDLMGAAFTIALSIIGMAGFILMMSQQSNSLPVLGFASFCIGLIAVATTALGYLTVLTRWFEQRLGLAYGVAMLGFGIGTMIFPLVAQTMITNWGWRNAYFGLAAIAIIGGGLSWVLLFVVAGAQNVADKTIAVVKHSVLATGDTISEAMASSRYWLLALVLFLVSAASLGLVVHMPAMLSDRSVNADVAARIVAIGGLGVLVGRLLAGAMMDRYAAPVVGGCAFLLGSLGLVLFGLVPSSVLWLTFAAAFFVAFAIGAEGDFIPFVVRRYFGMKYFGSVYGSLFCIFALGGIAGPVLFGFSFDRLGSYTPAVLVAAGVCFFAAVCTFFLGKYRFEAVQAH
jgi:MFS transporter, OFA family, oxalate/formate antiporter